MDSVGFVRQIRFYIVYVMTVITNIMNIYVYIVKFRIKNPYTLERSVLRLFGLTI